MVETDFEFLLGQDLPWKVLCSANHGGGERELDMKTDANELGLSSTELGDEGLRLLCERKFGAQLKRLDISNTRVTERGLSRLESAQRLFAFKDVTYDRSSQGLTGGNRRFEIVAKTQDAAKPHVSLASINSDPRLWSPAGGGSCRWKNVFAKGRHLVNTLNGKHELLEDSGFYEGQL